ncbi:hypothetical protein [Streptomyces iconiensis]|uniref:Uncharacterized protein n=1 Tax=Streptomyces iconiensis TaxID=1384038 RepID=A0ABT7A988_9ACTN|nr:hypothetical protein [Streptomyces iconiensis]MDJ1137927.1 hypothetical protein [Streptomyces iconiensis]
MTETSHAAGPEAAAGPRDFSRPRERKQFVIDDDTFEACRALPGEDFVVFIGHFEEFDGAGSWRDNFKAVVAALELVLLPDSFARARARLSDKEHPIELDQIVEVLEWLVGEYADRPTQPSSDSSDGSDDQESGTSSTESTPPEEPISVASVPTGS